MREIRLHPRGLALGKCQQRFGTYQVIGPGARNARSGRPLRPASDWRLASPRWAGVALSLVQIRSGRNPENVLLHWTKRVPLIPLRSLVAAQLAPLDDELQIFAKRDLRLLITHQDKPVIVQDYQSATPAGKQFIEQVLGEIDPAFANSLHLGAPGQAPMQ